MKRPVIYTDLDGSLLDHYTYEATSAKSLLRQLDNLGTPGDPLYQQDSRGSHSSVSLTQSLWALHCREWGLDLCAHELAHTDTEK